jgi:hypothetical protein
MIHRFRLTDKEEIDELRKKLEECRKENEELKKDIALLPNFKFDLTKRQKAIIKFITNNPGKNKEDIIKKLTQDSQGSLMTIRKDIKILEEEYNMIISKKDKSNRWISQFYINEDSILLDTYNNLNNFKKNFIETIDNIVKDENWSKNVELNKFDIVISSLILIYVHTLNTYITYILLEWSNKLENDTTLLNKLFSLIFFTFVEINLKLINSFRIPYVKPLTGLPTFKEITSPVSQGFLYNQFLLKPHIILNVLKEYQKIKLHPYIFPLLDSAWKISSPVYENISMFGPSTNEIKLRPLRQIHYTDTNLSLLLFHYIRDHCNKFEQKIILPRFPEPTLISPSFDIPIRRDEVFYKTILLETIGQEKYSEINQRFLVNELSRFVEYLQGLEYKKRQITKWKKEYPNGKTFEIKCTKYVQIIENFISTILENKIIENTLSIFIKLVKSKSEKSKELNNSITLNSLESFFRELAKYRDLEKEIDMAHIDVMNAVKLIYKNHADL